MFSIIKNKQRQLHIIFCLAPDFIGAELALMEQLYILKVVMDTTELTHTYGK